MCTIIENIVFSYPNANISIFGDFNLPFLKWNNSSNGPPCLPKNTSVMQHEVILSIISDTCDVANLMQINEFTNVHNSILDLVFCNSIDCVLSLCNDFVLPIDDYHPPLQLYVMAKKIILIIDVTLITLL